MRRRGVAEPGGAALASPLSLTLSPAGERESPGQVGLRGRRIRARGHRRLARRVAFLARPHLVLARRHVLEPVVPLVRRPRALDDLAVVVHQVHEGVAAADAQHAQLQVPLHLAIGLALHLVAVVEEERRLRLPHRALRVLEAHLRQVPAARQLHLLLVLPVPRVLRRARLGLHRGREHARLRSVLLLLQAPELDLHLPGQLRVRDVAQAHPRLLRGVVEHRAHLGHEHVAGEDLEAAPALLALAVERHHVDHVLARRQPGGVPAEAQLGAALHRHLHVVHRERQLRDAARLVVQRRGVERDLVGHVLAVGEAADRDAGHVDRHQPEHRPHRLALLAPVLPALRGAPGAVGALLAQQVREPIGDGPVAVREARHLEGVDRLAGGEGVAVLPVERPAAVVVLPREDHLLQAHRRRLTARHARGRQPQQREREVLHVHAFRALPALRAAGEEALGLGHRREVAVVRGARVRLPPRLRRLVGGLHGAAGDGEPRVVVDDGAVLRLDAHQLVGVLEQLLRLLLVHVLVVAGPGGALEGDAGGVTTRGDALGERADHRLDVLRVHVVLVVPRGGERLHGDRLHVAAEALVLLRPRDGCGGEVGEALVRGLAGLRVTLPVRGCGDFGSLADRERGWSSDDGSSEKAHQCHGQRSGHEALLEWEDSNGPRVERISARVKVENFRT